MDTLEGSYDEVVVVYGDDAGSLTGLVVKCPAGDFLCVVYGTVGNLFQYLLRFRNKFEMTL